jgi:thiol-disulfide isomerase/thioredoxin
MLSSVGLAVLLAVTATARATGPAPGRPLPPLTGATAWLNSPPLSPEQLRGKVVVIDFWTYTCINWRRTAPYLRAWVERYSDDGLVVIGVHSPEFAFERNLDNVRELARELGIDYPIAVDTDFAIWRAFDNQYWPALYVFDANGRLRHEQFGEGGYDDAEKVIRQLLAENARRPIDARLARVDARGAEAPADWDDLKSPETYLGARQARGFASPRGMVAGQDHRYAAPARLELNTWALAGRWTVENDRAIAESPQARITYRFHARDLHLILGPQTRGGAVRFRVLIDGKPPGAAHGLDVDSDGYGVVREQRMYQLVRQQGPIDDRLFEIEFLEPGAAAFCFTFG